MRIVLMRTIAWMALLSAQVVGAAPLLSYRVIAAHPHDATSFTEGFAINRGRLFESSGRNGQSMVVIRDLNTMKLLKSVKLDDRDFGEGLTVVGGQVVQLTWKSGVGYMYDMDLHRQGSFAITSEGWGLAYDGHQLIRSDGSSTLQMLDPRSYREKARVTVHDGNQQIDQLNELEFAKGKLYANVWLTDRIAVIEPQTGIVKAWLDLSDLKRQFAKPAEWSEGDNVLNGIAYDPASGNFFVTGKCWPVVFEIALDKSGSAH